MFLAHAFACAEFDSLGRARVDRERGWVDVAPREGIEPPTKRLTAARSTAELPGINGCLVEVVFHQESGRLSRIRFDSGELGKMVRI